MRDLNGEIAAELLQSLASTCGLDKRSQNRRKVAHGVLGMLSADQQRLLLLFHADHKDFERVAAELSMDMLSLLRAYVEAMHEFTRIVSQPGRIKRLGTRWTFQASDATAAASRAHETKTKPKTLPVLVRTWMQAHQFFKISPTDPISVKRAAYLRKIKEHHPDFVFTDTIEVRQAAEEAAKRVNHAWDLIQSAPN